MPFPSVAAPLVIQTNPAALVARFRGFSMRALLLKPSAVGAYVGTAVAMAATEGDGDAGGAADDAAGAGAPPHVTRTTARMIGLS